MIDRLVNSLFLSRLAVINLAAGVPAAVVLNAPNHVPGKAGPPSDSILPATRDVDDPRVESVADHRDRHSMLVVPACVP